MKLPNCPSFTPSIKPFGTDRVTLHETTRKNLRSEVARFKADPGTEFVTVLSQGAAFVCAWGRKHPAGPMFEVA